MSLAAMKKLMFTIGLNDKASGGVVSLTQKIKRMTNTARSGFMNMATGVGGIAGAAYSINGLVSPALELKRATNEVASLEVNDIGLQGLRNTALTTSIDFGLSAKEITGAGYDIQSAIDGLTPDNLATFTQGGAILAKGVKAQTGEITDYIGNLTNQFASQASAMGKNKWVEVLAGQTATAVKMFKTTGSRMNAAFSSLQGAGAAINIPLQEQMAVLGQLQSGGLDASVAGTAYKGFISRAFAAQKVMGLKFTDNSGNLLPVVDILKKIQGKFGNLSDEAKVPIFSKAFGQETVGFITTLMPMIDNLDSNIATLGSVTNMDQAIRMARAMTDEYQQLQSSSYAIRIAWGSAIMDTIRPLIRGMVEAAKSTLKFTENFPKLTRFLAGSAVAILAVIAGVSALSIAVGVFKFMSVGAGVATMAFNGMLTAGKLAIVGYQIGIVWARKALLGFQLLVATQSGIMAGFRVAMMLGASGVWAFTTALLANPITWVVAGVIALGYGLYKLVKHWDAVSTGVKRFADNHVGIQLMRIVLQAIGGLLQGVWWLLKQAGSAIAWVFGKAVELGEASGIFTDISNAVKGLFEWVNKLLTPFKDFTKTLKDIADNGVVNIVMDFLGLSKPELPELTQPVNRAHVVSQINGEQPEFVKTRELVQHPKSFSLNRPEGDLPKVPTELAKSPVVAKAKTTQSETVKTTLPVAEKPNTNKVIQVTDVAARVNAEKPQLPVANTPAPNNVVQQTDVAARVNAEKPQLPVANTPAPNNVVQITDVAARVNAEKPQLPVANTPTPNNVVQITDVAAKVNAEKPQLPVVNTPAPNNVVQTTDVAAKVNAEKPQFPVANRPAPNNVVQISDVAAKVNAEKRQLPVANTPAPNNVVQITDVAAKVNAEKPTVPAVDKVMSQDLIQGINVSRNLKVSDPSIAALQLNDQSIQQAINLQRNITNDQVLPGSREVKERAEKLQNQRPEVSPILPESLSSSALQQSVYNQQQKSEQHTDNSVRIDSLVIKTDGKVDAMDLFEQLRREAV